MPYSSASIWANSVQRTMSANWLSPWRTSRAQRLLGDDLRQDDVVVRVRRVGRAGRVEARGVGREDVAAAGEEGGAHFLDLLDDDRLEGHLVGAEVVGEVELGGGAGLHADRGAVQLLGALHAELLVHHEALAVIVVDAGEVEAERGVARQRPGRGAGQQVDLARLQRGEALLGGGRHVLDLVGIAEDRGGDGAAGVDVEARPLALAVGGGEACDAGADAADQRLPRALMASRSLPAIRRTRSADQRGRDDAGGHVLLEHFVLPFVVASAVLSGLSRPRTTLAQFLGDQIGARNGRRRST